MTSCTEVTIMNCSAMICSGLKIVVPLLWSNVVERTLACIYQNWQPSAMTLLTTTSVGRNRNSSEGSLRSPSSKRSWTSVRRNRYSSEGSLRSPSLFSRFFGFLFCVFNSTLKNQPEMARPFLAIEREKRIAATVCLPCFFAKKALNLTRIVCRHLSPIVLP